MTKYESILNVIKTITLEENIIGDAIHDKEGAKVYMELEKHKKKAIREYCDLLCEGSKGVKL